MKLLVFLLLTLAAPLAAYAEDAPSTGGNASSADHVSQLGVFFGRSLPHGISSSDDIFTLWGLRYSMPFGVTEKSGAGKFVDFGFIGGNGSDVHWGGLSVDVSMQAPFETLVASVGLGVDFTQYSSDTTSTKFVFGEHFLGSVMTRLGGSSFLRFDMKFNSQPGTTVFFGLGVVFDIGTAEGAGSS
jgi:hypothetical protein